MNPEFSNALLVLAYLALGMIGIALLLSWALKRFAWPGQPPSKMTRLIGGLTFPPRCSAQAPELRHGARMA